jgi:RsmE family RNA methyltransferase
VAISTDDRVFFVGDLLTRGPDALGVLSLFRSVRARSALGNHEQRLLAAHHARQRGEAGPKLGASHADVAAQLNDDDWAVLESFPLWIDLPEHDVRVVHAGVVPGVPFEAQDPWLLTHIRSITEDGKPSEKWGTLWGSVYRGSPHVVFGHNARQRPQLHPSATGLDTACVYGCARAALTPTTVASCPGAELARVVRVPLTGLSPGERELDERATHYLRDVLRLRSGDAFLAFDAAAQLEADAALGEGTETSARCTLGEPRSAGRVVSSGIVLVQALGKGDKTEQVVRSATALGVAELHLVESARSVARAGGRADSKRARLESIALDAARQSLRGDVPQICGPHAFERELEHWRGRAQLKLCLVPGAPETLRALTREWSPGAPIGLLVGPEGGLSEAEVVHAEQAGFVRCRFGELVLRTEIAGIAALGALLLLGDP